jgi:hypothetical protein
LPRGFPWCGVCNRLLDQTVRKPSRVRDVPGRGAAEPGDLRLGELTYDLPGEPMTMDPSGISLPSVMSALAPIMQLRPMRARFSTTALIPIRLLSPMVQPWSMTLWPTVTFSPMVSGHPASVCRTEPSCTFEFAPTLIRSLSPRSTALNQMLD